MDNKTSQSMEELKERRKAVKNHIEMYTALAEKYKKYDDDKYEVRDGKLYRELKKFAKRKLFWLRWPFILLRRLCYNQ